jgi:Fur family ferric uptake transcriptional regulator
MTDTIEGRCEARGLRMTEQRRVIAQVLEEATDHPDVEELRASSTGSNSATVAPATKTPTATITTT